MAETLITYYSATDLAALLIAGEISAVEVAEAFIDQCQARAPLNALINFEPQRYLEAAKAADDVRTAGAVLGPLHGLPLVIKDNIDVAGFATTAATPALRNNHPNREGGVIGALRAAGAIVMAKANLHELAFSPGIGKAPSGEEMVRGDFGPARNPYNLERMTGGSSSGTAAALAARMAPAGLGTDTGGSVRNPASFCGVVGFRPSTGRYSQLGVVPISRTRDTIGPMTRSVADAELIDRCVTGRIAPVSAVALEGLRLGIARDYFFDGAHDDVASVLSQELSRLEDAGATIVERDFPELERLAKLSREAIAMFECVPNLTRYLNEVGGPSIDELFDQAATTGLTEFLHGLAGENAVSGETYSKGLHEFRPRMQAAYAEYFRDQDIAALVYPATLMTAPLFDVPAVIERRGETVTGFMAEVHNSQPASIAGTPDLVVPAAMTAAGLPIGLTFSGPAGGDEHVLAIGMAYEAIRPALPAPDLGKN